MDNPLSKLALDYWYKVLMVVGFVVFLLAGTGTLAAFPAAPTALISLGVFFIGLGEWINHPLKEALVAGNVFFPPGKISGHPRSPRALGYLFDLLGAISIIVGIYKLFV